MSSSALPARSDPDAFDAGGEAVPPPRDEQPRFQARHVLMRRLADVVCLPESRINAFERAVTAEVDYTPDGNFNDWMPRNGTFVGLDFPRTISWGIDTRGRRWLRVATDIELEFRR